MAKYVLALDQGTTSSRAIAFDQEGRAVEVCDTVMAADAYVLSYELATDVDLLIDLLSGPLLSRALFTMAPVDQALLETLVDVVIGGLGNLESSGGVGPT